LTALYNQLQGVMPLLRDIVQSGTVEEGTALYASGPAPSDDAGPRYRFEKRGKESWAVLDGYAGDSLVVLTNYKKGAQAVMERLEAYERRIAELSHRVEVTPSSRLAVLLQCIRARLEKADSAGGRRLAGGADPADTVALLRKGPVIVSLHADDPHVGCLCHQHDILPQIHAGACHAPEHLERVF
jgi:hypothetical protein